MEEVRREKMFFFDYISVHTYGLIFNDKYSYIAFDEKTHPLGSERTGIFDVVYVSILLE